MKRKLLFILLCVFLKAHSQKNFTNELNTVSFTYQEEITYSLLGTNTSKFAAYASGSGKVNGTKNFQGLKIDYVGSEAKNGSFLNINGNYSYSSNCTELKSSSFGSGTFKDEWLTFSFEFDETTQTGWASLHCEGDGTDDGTKGPTGDYCLEPRKVIGVDAGNCIKSDGGYIVTVSDRIETRTPMGNAGEELTIRTYSFTAYINSKPLDLDAVIKPLSSNEVPYEKWLPEGERPNTKNGAEIVEHKGNTISFGVGLIDKNTKLKLFPDEAIVTYELLPNEITQNTGSCLNYPFSDAKEKLDLEFDEDTYRNNALVAFFSKTKIITQPKGGLLLSAVIRSKDFAAYGKLKATIMYKGRDYEAHTDKNVYLFSIPLDENNNKIADAWEKDSNVFNKKYANNWDNEHVDKNNNDGDGLTIYEEYRGIIANGKHVRLSPEYKDLILANDVGDKLKPGFKLLENATQILITEIKKDELDPTNHIININKSISKNGEQHAILCVKHNFDKSTDKYDVAEGAINNDIMGFVVPKVKDANGSFFESPKDCIEYRINQNRLDQAYNVKINIAHEIGHGCGLSHHSAESPIDFKLFKKRHFNSASEMRDSLIIVNSNGEIIYTKNRNSLLDVNIFRDNLMMDELHASNTTSGDVKCFMTYNMYLTFAFTKDPQQEIKYKVDDGLSSFYYIRTLFITPFGENELFNGKNDIKQNKFCTDGNGTEWNSDGKLFGNAINYNCFGKFRIKDF